MKDLDGSPSYNRRFLAVLVISFLLMMGWGYISPRPVAPPENAREPVAAATAPAPAAAPAAPDTGAPAVPAPDAAQEASARRVVAANAAWSVELSNVGGRLTSWKLLDQGDYADRTQPLDVVRRRAESGLEAQDVLPLQVVTGDAALDARLAAALHVVTSETTPEGQVLTARWSDGAGTSVEKILTLRDDARVATLDARVTVAGKPIPFRLAWGPGFANHTPAERSNVYFRRGSIAWLDGGKVRQIAKPDAQGALPDAAATWVAFQDSYFAVIVTPSALASSSSGREWDGATAGFRVSGELRPNEKGKLDKKDWPDELVLEIPFTPELTRQVIHVGPRDRPALRALDAAFRKPPQLGLLTNLGMLDPIAQLLHVPMLKFHAWTGSWGVSIILLTIVVALVTAPMQFISMRKMRAMQDKMKPVQARLKALDEKYKRMPASGETRMKHAEEKQRLMLEAGVNPAETLSGCLPTLITMPVFFALLRLLPSAPEFRHQAFLFWSDLGAADATHVSPIAAAILTLVATKLGMASSSQSVDPVQKNMLYMFPLMLVWLCWSAPLAFVLYQVIRSGIQIGQQQLFNLMLPPQGKTPSPARQGKPVRADLHVDTADVVPGEPVSRPAATRKKGRKR